MVAWNVPWEPVVLACGEGEEMRELFTSPPVLVVTTDEARGRFTPSEASNAATATDTCAGADAGVEPCQRRGGFMNGRRQWYSGWPGNCRRAVTLRFARPKRY